MDYCSVHNYRFSSLRHIDDAYVAGKKEGKEETKMARSPITRLNIGAGPWTREGWATLDNPCPHYTWPEPPDIAMDLTEMKPIPLEGGSVDLIFCSHLVEHLFDDQVDYLFDEVRRVLRPGGVFRVTCPDVEWSVAEYKGNRMSAIDFARSFKADFEGFNGSMAYGAYDEIESFGAMRAAATFSRLNKRDTNKHHPERHVNWFDAEKLVSMLRAAGFASCRQARRFDSASPDMRDPAQFDYSHVYMSLFAEAIK